MDKLSDLDQVIADTVHTVVGDITDFEAETASSIRTALRTHGYVIVKLPDTDRPWGLHDGWTAGDGDYCVAAGCGHVYFSDEDAVSQVSPEYARGLAAALLAAAEAAEKKATHA